MKFIKKHLCLMFLIMLMINADAGFAAGESVQKAWDIDENSIIDLNTAIAVDLDDVRDTYLISQSGTYVLTGSLNGRVKIQASKTDAVRLVLNNATIVNPKGPAIEGMKAQQVILILPEETRSSISSGPLMTADKKGAEAAIDVETDLLIVGSGSLDIVSQTAHGIFCKGNLLVREGGLTIRSSGDGLRAKDSIYISGGDIQIKSGGDGIVSTGSKDGKGTVRVDGGSIYITAGQDGIQAGSSLTISGGSFSIFTGKGGTPVHFIGDEPVSGEQDIMGQTIGQDSSLMAQTNDKNGSKSKEGLKSKTSIIIQGGSFNLNTQDDAISSLGDIVIHGGEFSILTGDDGIYAQDHLHIKGGNIKIIGCYEGLESKTITIDGGSIDITASDDGINAASPEGKGEQYEQEVWIVINGGTVKIVAGYDAIDTNGTLTIRGGKVDLSIKYFGKANAAIDTDAGYFYEGGEVTTNDGSEKTYRKN